MKDVRKIRCGNQKDIIVIPDGAFICVYRTQERKSTLPICEPGVPSDCSEFFKMEKSATDKEIKQCVELYEAGHGQGWRDGQWALRKELRQMLGINDRSAV